MWCDLWKGHVAKTVQRIIWEKYFLPLKSNWRQSKNQTFGAAEAEAEIIKNLEPELASDKSSSLEPGKNYLPEPKQISSMLTGVGDTYMSQFGAAPFLMPARCPGLIITENWKQKITKNTNFFKIIPKGFNYWHSAWNTFSESPHRSQWGSIMKEGWKEK